MTVTTYGWANAVPSFLLNTNTPGDQAQPAIVGNVTGTGYFGAWTFPQPTDEVGGRFVDRDGAPATNELGINTTVEDDQNAVSLAGLADGRFIATFTDHSLGDGTFGNDIRGRLFNADGSPVGNDFGIVTAGTSFTESDVAALADGGFVVSFTHELAENEDDIGARVFNADGSTRALLGVYDGGGKDAALSSVAGLAGGGFVVAWQESRSSGSAAQKFETEVRFRRFDANGTALDGTSGVLIDTDGTINRDIQIVGLPDGGFVVAYTDNGWNGLNTDITARVFNADGTIRSPYLQVNSAVNGGITAGDQDKPTLTVLSNGGFAVGWSNGSQFNLQAFDPAGKTMGSNGYVMASSIEAEIAGLSGGRIGVISESTISDGNGTSIRSGAFELVRTIMGDGTDETIVGVGDSLREVLHGLGGDDILEGRGGPDELNGGDGFDYASYASAPTGVVASLTNSTANTGDAARDTYSSIEGLIGGAFDDRLIGDGADNILLGNPGNDTLRGAGGNDLLDGGAGDDTAEYGQNLGQFTIQDFGGKIVVTGPAGTDTLVNIEHLKFADATLDVIDDGNALFDSLYYFSRNTDVYFAGANAIDHYNAHGWHEGRDPNALFDTSGYLAVNKDVAAAGVNPLDHYHQSGWQEGRDPSAWFDTTLYLLRNPDVAAAGIDPLAHYLQHGMAEGRQAYAAVGQIAGGFDAQYYLFHNPDVAAAGVDPLAHFNTYGWHEGRNPNAFFDTNGYLAAYGDVAGAGVNPLDHYHVYGWNEGRDPSGTFDTDMYLAAYGDVAAAAIDPLEHFMAYGIYEGRSAFGDQIIG